MGEVFRRWRFAWIVLIAFCAEAALAAGTYNPINLSQPPKASRDKIALQSPEAAHLTHDKSCRFFVAEPGLAGGDCDSIESPAAALPPGIDSAVIYKSQDRVAVSAHSVVAALSGVEDAKVAAIDLVALLLAIGKKLVFLSVVLPFLALKRLFQRGP